LGDSSTGRSGERRPTFGLGPLAYDYDEAAGEIEEKWQVFHDTAARKTMLSASMPAACETDRIHKTASGLRRSLDMLIPPLIWRYLAHPP
jgi:hypothetical protein